MHPNGAECNLVLLLLGLWNGFQEGRNIPEFFMVEGSGAVFVLVVQRAASLTTLTKVMI